MSRNEIRLRRQRLTARGTDRFRNYGAVLQQHEQGLRLKKIIRVFTFFAIILILVMLIIIIARIESRTEKTGVTSDLTGQLFSEKMNRG